MGMKWTGKLGQKDSYGYFELALTCEIKFTLTLRGMSLGAMI